MVESAVQSHAEIVIDSTEESKIRVLHVDDEPALLRVTKQCLELEAMFQVDSVTSVEEALAKLQKEQYDAVVSDYQMPVKDGLEFLEMLRKNGNTIPFILFTGKGREEIAIKALNLGADQYLNKTGDPETVYCELEHAIRRTVERTKAESALETCGERYGRLFESAVDGILINGSDGRISSLNPAAANILGYNSPKELIGKPAVELYADPDSRTRLLQELMEKGNVKERELTWKRKDGTLVEILASVTLKKDEKGNLRRTEGIIRDVSERKRSERLLRESEEKYRELAESISDVFFAFDKDLRYTYWNKASEKLTGTKAKNAIGKSLTEVFPDVKGTKVEQFYQNIVKTNQHQTFVNEYRVGDKDFAFEIDAYPAKDGLSVFVKDVTGRKKAEGALRESENYLKAVFSSIFTGVMVVNAETHEIVDANPNALAILGTSREQIIGRVCHNFICPADKGKCPISDLKQTVDNSERKLITADGHLKPIIKTVVPIKLKGQEYFVESFVDITERKKAEEALRESEEKYKDLFENALDVILTLDLKGCVTAVNNSILRFGYKKEDLVGKNILDFVSKAYSSTVMRDFSQVTQGEPAKNETEIVVPTGKILVEYNARPIAKESNVTGVQINLRDMTERKKSECELFDKQTRLQSIFDTSPSAILVIDLNGRIVDCNERAQEIFGYSSRSESVGRSALEPIAEEDRQRAMENMERTLKQGLMRSIEYAIVAKDGSKRQLSVTASVLRDVSGNPTSFVSAIEDITERKKAEKTSKRREAELSAIIENTSDSVWSIDNKGRLLFANTTFKRQFLLAYGVELKEGMDLKDLVPKAQIPFWVGTHNAAMKGGRFSLEQKLEIRGVSVDVEISVNPIINENGETVGATYFSRDITERKKSEELLRESEERFRGLFESIQDPVGIFVGREGRLIDYNMAFKKSSGYTDEELRGRVFLDFVHPDDHAMVLEKYRTEYPEDEFPLIYEMRGMNKKGEAIPLELSVSTYKKKGKVIGIEVIHRDLTERKKAEQALRESEERLRILFENAPDAYYLNDLKGHFIDGNKAAEEMTGYQKDELIGKSFLQLGLLPKKHVPTAAKLLALNALGRSTGPHELVLNRKDGTQIMAEIRTVPTKIDGKTVVLGIARDITERKKNEELVSESQQKFKGLFIGNPEAAAYLDPDFRIRDINPCFEELFGYSLADVQGKYINAVVVPDDRRKEGEALDKEARKGYVYRNTVRRKKDRSLVQVSVSAAPITVGDKVAGIVAIYHDISDLKNAEKRLDVMNEKLRVVGSLTRHDVRNKLSAVTGNAYLLRAKLAGNPETLEQLADMENAVRNVETIFEFARAYEKLGVEQLAYLSVGKVVDEASSLFPDLKGIRIANECGGLTVLADSLLRQLFYNLIDDSLKYGEKLTQIRVRYEEFEDKLKLIYEDDGVGISRDAKSKLFTEGFTTGKGSGYGLYLIRRMMDVYGWTINETGTHGKGAQFIISIPKTKSDGRQNYKLS